MMADLLCEKEQQIEDLTAEKEQQIEEIRDLTEEKEYLMRQLKRESTHSQSSSPKSKVWAMSFISVIISEAEEGGKVE